MKILLLGSGGREHAFAWKMSQSSLCSALYIAPGNTGTAMCGTNLPIQATDFEGIKKACLEHSIEMLVVGPEQPLVAGVADFFASDPALASIPVIGPSQEGAQLEGSKAYAKRFMARHSIPTAAYREFGKNELSAGLDYLADHPLPLVLKADGLAAGKGVIICETRESALSEFREMLEAGKFGDASARVVVEQFLDGIELSVFALSDDDSFLILPTAKDYKRIGEGNTGLNTGGMGAISPVPFADSAFMAKIESQVIRPTFEGLRSEGISYKGFLYFGLIRVDGEPFVIEYNARMGDPETQAVLPLIENDLVELFQAIGAGSLAEHKISLKNGTAATVILAAEGYPESYPKGMEIKGLESVSDSVVFHAGTRVNESGAVETSGGRVMAVSSVGTDMAAALKTSYDSINKVCFDKIYYRKDIGFDLK